MEKRENNDPIVLKIYHHLKDIKIKLPAKILYFSEFYLIFCEFPNSEYTQNC
jgi:hypothetical protein